MKKQGLGLIHHAGKEMAWGKGAKAGNFIFMSGAEARSEDNDEPVEGIMAQTQLALTRIKERLEEAGASMESDVNFRWYVKDRKMIPDYYMARDIWWQKIVLICVMNDPMRQHYWLLSLLLMICLLRLTALHAFRMKVIRI